MQDAVPVDHKCPFPSLPLKKGPLLDVRMLFCPRIVLHDSLLRLKSGQLLVSLVATIYHLVGRNSSALYHSQVQAPLIAGLT